MHTTPTSETDQLAGIVRRTIRSIGAQSSHVSDPQSTAAAARLISGRLKRAGIPVQWIEGQHGTPLVVAGSGPVAICTYLDDSHPDSGSGSAEPPELVEDQVRGHGIERRAAVVAHMATLIENPALAEVVTMIFESDRNAGSHTLDDWLSSQTTGLTVAAWEVGDLPLHAPLLVRSATGTLIAQIQLKAVRENVELVYGTVLPDLGIAIASLVTSLKSADNEVHLAGFYDGIGSPDEAEFQSLIQIGPGVSRWLTRVAHGERELSTAHMTLGMFCAPSLLVRDISIEQGGEYLPTSATAIVEFQLLPGQSVDQIITALEDHARSTAFPATVTPLLVRHPVGVIDDLPVPDTSSSIPIAPGPSPASLFSRKSIPGTGYALVGRTTERDVAGISIDAIVQSSVFLSELVASLTDFNP